jgi:drug/metabolite transporter (DMT)-like permease
MQLPVANGTEGGSWARTIIEVYMMWFTFFLSANIVAMAWIFRRRLDKVARSMVGPICWLLALANISTTASTFAVAAAVSPDAPGNYLPLIRMARTANSVVLIAFAVVWVVLWTKLRQMGQPTARGFQVVKRQADETELTDQG